MATFTSLEQVTDHDKYKTGLKSALKNPAGKKFQYFRKHKLVPGRLHLLTVDAHADVLKELGPPTIQGKCTINEAKELVFEPAKGVLRYRPIKKYLMTFYHDHVVWVPADEPEEDGEDGARGGGTTVQTASPTAEPAQTATQPAQPTAPEQPAAQTRPLPPTPPERDRPKWVGMDGDRKAVEKLIGTLETWNWPKASELRDRLTAIDGQATANRFDLAVAAFPQLKADVVSASQTAKAKRECDAAWQPVAPLRNQAKGVPAITPAIGDLVSKLATAYSTLATEYSLGKYGECLPLVEKVKTAAEAVLRARKENEARIEGELKKRAMLSPEREAQANERLKALSKEDRKKYDECLAQAGSEPEKLNLAKALAAGYNVAEVERFAAKIRGKDEQWLQDNLRVTGSSDGKGVRQQFKMSCQATMVQAVKGELDPIYALKLHEENAALNQVQADTELPIAKEQKALLETPLDPNEEKVKQQNLTDANAAAANLSATDLGTVKAALQSAQSNYERNQILRAIGDGQSASAVSALAAQIRGKPKPGGQAVHKLDATGGKGVGRRGQDLLENVKDSTGLKYKTVMVSATTRAGAVDDVADNLSKGRPVPLSVGSTDGQTAHYVLAVAWSAGPPKTFYIHDPGSGTTVARTEEQLKNNQMDLPSGWSRLNKYEKPEPA